MTALQQKKRRKIVLISPLFQGGIALAFAALVVAGAAAFSVLVTRSLGRTLGEAALMAHYRFQSAYDVVGPDIVRHVGWLFAGTLAAGIALFLFVAHGVRAGAERIAAVFRISGEGDLSTPTDAPGPGDFPVLGEQIDAARSGTLRAIGEIRAEVDTMRKERLADEDFLKRWERLKERMGRIAP